MVDMDTQYLYTNMIFQCILILQAQMYSQSFFILIML